MSAAVLIDLAARCEREEPSADLDQAICAAVKPEDLDGACWEDYTTSLDSAVTLVPEGLRIRMTQAETYWFASLHRGHEEEATLGQARTEPMARCAAALRARAAITGDAT